MSETIERGLLLGTIIEYSDIGVKLSDYHEVITLIDGVMGTWNG